MKKIAILIVSWLFVFLQLSFAQNTMPVKDSADVKSEAVIDAHSTVQTLSFKPNPQRSVLYSALVPGLGQIYNRKYWKLPFVYAGYAALIYAISWNGNNYSKYKKAYISIADTNADTNDFVSYIPSGEDVVAFQNNPTDMNWLTEVLNQKQLSYRSNRDLAIISIIGFYGLTLLDAYVDAQLYDFDISPNLSMRVEPYLENGYNLNRTTLGLRCELTF